MLAYTVLLDNKQEDDLLWVKKFLIRKANYCSALIAREAVRRDNENSIFGTKEKYK